MAKRRERLAETNKDVPWAQRTQTGLYKLAIHVGFSNGRCQGKETTTKKKNAFLHLSARKDKKLPRQGKAMLQMPINGSCVIDTKQLGRKDISCPQLHPQTKPMGRLEKLFWNLSGIFRFQSLQRLTGCCITIPMYAWEGKPGEKVCLGRSCSAGL